MSPGIVTDKVDSGSGTGLKAQCLPFWYQVYVEQCTDMLTMLKPTVVSWRMLWLESDKTH